MPRLAFLPPTEKRNFDSPPILTKEQRPAYFVVTEDIRKTLSSLRTVTNKVGFLLQLGYFKHSGKFFVPASYRGRDINYVKRLLNITEDIDLDEYPPARMVRHRFRILALMDWTSFDKSNSILLAERVQLLTQQQLKIEPVFSAAVDFCWKHQIEIPSYHQLSVVITDSFNIVESELLSNLRSGLQPRQTFALDELISTSLDQVKPLLEEMRRLSQSLRALEIQRNVSVSKKFGNYFHQFRSVLEKLDLQDQATQYYATWVHKAKLAQLQQFPNPHKRYLHLLAYLKHQYLDRQDVLMDIFQKCVTAVINQANRQQIIREKKCSPCAGRPFNRSTYHKKDRATFSLKLGA